ncbi:HCP-like protein [Backusella circina FSU 941]|nr:HCP-like protein [Backusella circina FSU 941]
MLKRRLDLVILYDKCIFLLFKCPLEKWSDHQKSAYIVRNCITINVISSTEDDTITTQNREDNGLLYNEGKRYFDSILTQQISVSAFERIRSSAEKGEMVPQFHLAESYALGKGTQQNHTEAYKWYTKAAIQGYKKASIRIHNLYQNDKMMHCRGQLDSGETEWAEEDFKEENHIRELNEYRLEQLKSILNGTIKYYSDEFSKCRSLTENGEADGEVLETLAFLFQHGYGVKKYIKRAIDLYLQAAEMGYIDAQYNVAYLYQKTSSIKFHYRKAFYWYTKAAEGGHVAAQNGLAYFYEKGLATDVDYKTSIFWYTKAAEAGNSDAQLSLGRIYRKGEYVEKNLDKAVKWYGLASQQGHPAAQNCLNKMHQNGMITDHVLNNSSGMRNRTMTERLCQKLHFDIKHYNGSLVTKQIEKLASHALVGDGNAMYQIGLMYYHGTDFLEDKDTGFKWIKKAAISGIQEAQLAVADMFKEGEDAVDQNYYQSSIWYLKCARQKNNVAQYNLGVLYDNGLGVRNDPLEASKWFTKSSDQGNSDAFHSLGLLRLKGRGLRKNLEEAVNYFRTAVKLKHFNAMFELGSIYIKDNRFAKEKDMGLLLYEYIAKNGHTNAQLELATMYDTGEFISRDYEKAEKYYLMIEPNGGELQYEMAIKYLKGDAVDQDYLKAFYLFKKSEENGYVKTRGIFDYSFKFDIQIINSQFIEMLTWISENGIESMEYRIGSLLHDTKFNDLGVSIEWYRKAAEKSDSRAQWVLGYLYEKGNYLTEDLKLAFDYYSQSYKNDNTDSMVALGCMFLYGRYVRQDFLRAFNLFTEAVNMGHENADQALNPKLIGRIVDICIPNTEISYYIDTELIVTMLEAVAISGNVAVQYNLGCIFLNFWQDHKRAIKFFKLASNLGMPDASYNLGTIYEEGRVGLRGTCPNYPRAMEFYEKAIEKDHDEALYRLARLHHYGIGTEIDFDKAYDLYSRAAALGNTSAYRVLNITLSSVNNMGASVGQRLKRSFGSSIFFDKDSDIYQQSLLMCQHVAIQGNIELQYKLGYIYENIFNKPDYEEAVKWYTIAAHNLHREAGYRLGRLYERGLGTYQDYQKSMSLFKQAYDHGSINALYRLAETYYYGNGTERDFSKALVYYKEAADHGQPEAQRTLGKLYENGMLVQQDILEAIKWYNRAYLQGLEIVESDLYTMYDDLAYKKHSKNKLYRMYTSISQSLYFSDNKKYHDNYGSVLYRLGLWYFEGNIVPKDNTKAMGYFLKASLVFSYKGARNFLNISLERNEEAYLQKCKMYEETAEVIPYEYIYPYIYDYYIENRFRIYHDYQKIQCYLKDFSDFQKEDIMKKLGYKYEYGVGVEKNIEKAIYWYGQASDQSYNRYNSNALRILALHLENMNFYDGSKALEFYMMAAESGSGEACLFFGQLYHCHDNFQDFSKALKYYMKATAESRYKKFAQHGIGLLYEHGDGVPQDYVKAVELYESSYDNGNQYASYQLGLMYFHGKGVKQNYTRSFDFFKTVVSTVNYANDKYVFVQEAVTDATDETARRKRFYSYENEISMKTEANYYIKVMYANGFARSINTKNA